MPHQNAVALCQNIVRYVLQHTLETIIVPLGDDPNRILKWFPLALALFAPVVHVALRAVKERLQIKTCHVLRVADMFFNRKSSEGKMSTTNSTANMAKAFLLVSNPRYTNQGPQEHLLGCARREPR